MQVHVLTDMHTRTPLQTGALADVMLAAGLDPEATIGPIEEEFAAMQLPWEQGGDGDASGGQGDRKSDGAGPSHAADLGV